MFQTITGWFWVNLPYACGGVKFYHGVVSEAAPIYTWMYGKSFETVEAWVEKKNGVMERCP